MSTKQINSRIQIKSDTSANWHTASIAENPFIPLKGEFIHYDDLEGHNIKLGDGIHTPDELDWIDNNQVQADWDQTDENAVDFIKNKTHGYELVDKWGSKTSTGFIYSTSIPKLEITPVKNVCIDLIVAGSSEDISYEGEVYYEFDTYPPIEEITIGQIYATSEIEEDAPVITVDVIASPDGMISFSEILGDMPLKYTWKYDTIVGQEKQVVQLDPMYISLPLEKGEAENSITDKSTAVALTENSIAIGDGSVAGCQGYYIKAFDFSLNRLYLSTTQNNPPEVAPKLIFAYNKFDTVGTGYAIYEDGIELDPIGNFDARIKGVTIPFKIYAVTSSTTTITFVDGKYETNIFTGEKHYDTYASTGQSVALTTKDYIVINYNRSGNYWIDTGDRKQFTNYCIANPQKIDEYYDSEFVTGYTAEAAGEHFYTINGLHYITDDAAPGVLDATISNVDGNCISWEGDIGYDTIGETKGGYYDYSFMVPSIPNPGPNAINLKPSAWAIGEENQAIGRLSLAIGRKNYASQDYGFIFGSGSETGYQSTSIGLNNKAYGNNGAIIGGSNNIIGKSARYGFIGAGRYNRIEGKSSDDCAIFGSYNKISGDNLDRVFMAGFGLRSSAAGQIVLGQGNATDWSAKLIIGNGDVKINTDNNTATAVNGGNNIFTVYNDGRVASGRILPQGAYDLTPKTYVDTNFLTKSAATNTYVTKVNPEFSGELIIDNGLEEDFEITHTLNAQGDVWHAGTITLGEDRKEVAVKEDIFDENNKVQLSLLPDTILGQLKYGGVVGVSDDQAAPSMAFESVLKQVIKEKYLDDVDVITWVYIFKSSQEYRIDVTYRNNTGETKVEDLALTDSELFEGFYFIIGPAGLDSGVGSDFTTGDWLVFQNNTGVKIDNTDAVRTVNGKIGDVKLHAEDVDAYDKAYINKLEARIKTLEDTLNAIGTLTITESDNTLIVQ